MTITAKHVGTKYAGAGHLNRGIQEPSPLAVRIANVLGQVYSGIYHVNATQAQLNKLRSPAKEYTLCLFGSLATTDFDTLTRLLLCTTAANLEVSIAGSRKGSLRLTFKDATIDRRKSIYSILPDFPTLAVAESDGFISDLKYPLIGGLSHKSRFLSVHWNADEAHSISGFSLKSGSIDMQRLEEIVWRAHAACARAEINGRCPTGNGQIRLYWTQRSRTATTIMEGHPTPQQAIDQLRPLWDIDYTRVD